MIAGGDEGKLHLIDKDLRRIRSTYVGACLHAGIVVGDYVYVSVKNDSYKLQVFELATFKLLHSFPIPYQVIKFITYKVKKAATPNTSAKNSSSSLSQFQQGKESTVASTQ